MFVLILSVLFSFFSFLLRGKGVRNVENPKGKSLQTFNKLLSAVSPIPLLVRCESIVPLFFLLLLRGFLGKSSKLALDRLIRRGVRVRARVSLAVPNYWPAQ